MTLGTICVCVSVFGLGLSPQSREVDAFSVSDLANGQHIEVQTDDLVFQFEVVDNTTGAMNGKMSKDGKSFGKPARVFVISATRSPQAGDGGIAIGHMHKIETGMSMELGVFNLEKGNRWITSPVRRISLRSNGDAANQE